MKPILTKCDRCDGTGLREIAEELRSTLSMLRAFKNGATTEQLHAKGDGDKITRNAFNRRLEELRKLGLVSRVRVGKFFKYKATK